MPIDTKRLRRIYERTDGYCHICHKKLSFINYGVAELRGGWEIEHSRPRCKGGTDHGNNLYPACVSCNRDKSAYTTKTARRWNGTSKAPLSKIKKAALREENADVGTIIGGLLGIVGGPLGIATGAYIGRQIGKNISPPKV